MTTNELIARIRSKILESGSELVTDATILQDLNFANDDITKRTFTNASVISETVNFSNGLGTLPATFGTAYDDAIDSDGNYYKELNIADFTKETQPYSYTIEAGVIKVFPTTTASFTLRFWPKTVTLSASQDPTINSLLQKCLISGALAEIYEDLQDEQLATYYKQKYELELQQKLATLSNYEEENQKSGEMFTAQTLI